MSRTKRNTLITIAVIMATTLVVVCAVTAFTAGFVATLNTSANATTYYAGDTVIITATLESVTDVRGLAGLDISDLVYDTSKLTLKKAEAPKLPDGWAMYGSTLPLMIVDDRGSSPAKEKGAIEVKFYFTVNSDATPGNTQIDFVCSGTNAEVLESVNVEITSVTIAIAHTHQYGEYIKVDDATHKRVCKICNKEEVLPHTWDNGVITVPPTESAEGVKTYTCEACGATKTEAVPQVIRKEPYMKIAEKSVSLEDSIYMYLAVETKNVTGNVYLLVFDKPQTVYTKENAVKVLPVDYVDGAGRSIFFYRDIIASKMTDTVYFAVHTVKDGKDFYSVPQKFSVVEYVSVVNQLTPDPLLKELTKNMLNYGASAQKYFKYRTDFLASDTVYKIKVTGAKMEDGFRWGVFKAGTAVTMTADAPEAGMVFSHFENEAGEHVCTSETFTVTATAAEKYRAIFVPTV